MKIWTIQPFSMFEELNEKGLVACDPDRSFNLKKSDSLKPYYGWLIDQMESRIGPRPEGVSYPIWAWHTWKGERVCPDPNSSAFLKRNEKKVLLTLDISQDRFVLTDFDLWQIVMMNGMIIDPSLSEEDGEKELDRLDTLEPAQYAKELKESWTHVFDISRAQYVQATFWQIKKDDVLEYQILET
ncbi:MAG: DUF3841 domain-containing protein [Pseudobutyrivibrio sp.]|nr:DUF3841 domain-containing protein [Pseudobutyrivibrio sp.]